MNVKKLFIFGAVLGFVVFWVIPLAQAAEEFQISYSCVNCHLDRYEEWRHSMHALAVSDPIFEAAYMKASKSEPKYREYCLTCHSPTTIITKDFNLKKSISIEGVTCSFCHTVTGVNNNSYIFNQSNPMYGPYADSKTDAHASAYSDLHTKSEFCAGCHEFSLNGVPISETYSEWKEGPYSAEGKQCQDCHMEAIRGFSTKNGTEREKIYKHFWYGGHSGQFLEKAFKIESMIQQKGNKAKVTLNITNINVGHKIPSGYPLRKVILNFMATNGERREIFNDKKVYTKTLLDEYGNEVYEFWKASSIANDNRIKPKETRMEVFEFEVPDGTGKLEIQATLTYQLEAEIVSLSKENVNVEIARMKEIKWLNETPVVSPTPKKVPANGWIGVVISMIAAILFSRRKMQVIKEKRFDDI